MPNKDLFGYDDSIPTLYSIADQPEAGAEIHLDRNLCLLEELSLLEPQPTQHKTIMGQQQLEALIEPIVKRKIQQFATELSRVIVREVIDSIEKEFKR